MEAEVTPSGDVLVEGQHVGQLNGFRFTADPQAAGEAAKALNAAAQKALASEIEGRANRVHEAVDDAFVLANDGTIRWLGEPVGKIAAGEHVLEPRVRILSDEQLTGATLETVQRRLDLWLAQHVKKLLGPLAELEAGEGLEGIARGIAFQVGESLGVLERTRVADEVKTLSQEARASLRKFGIRFGAYHLYLPALLKPAPRALAAQLWALKHGGVDEVKGLDEVPHLASSGRTSFVADKEVQKGFYRAAGFRVCGDRAVRVDILERLADLIRPAVAYRPGTTPGDPPPGTADGDGFVVTVAMTSLAGCSGESFASILRSLGYVVDRRKGPPITVPLVPKAATEPVKPPEPKSEAEASADSAPEIAAAETQNAEAQNAEAQDAEAQDAEAQVAPAETTALASPAEVEGVVPAPAEPAEDILAREPAVTHAEPEAQADIRLEAPAESLEGTTPEITPAAEDGHSETAAEAVVAAAPEAQADVAPETADASAASEEPLIEVWRPHRQHHHARRPDARGGKKFVERRERTAPGVATPPGAPADAPRPDAGPRRDRRHGDQRKPDHQPVAEGEAAAPAGEQRARVPHGGQDRGQGRPRGGEGPRDGQREGQRDQRRGGGPNRGGQGRPGQGRHDERQQGRGGHFSTEKRSHERPPDPNSPFAKLLALKAQLEDKNKDS